MSIDVDAIRGRADAATPGPWYQGRNGRLTWSESDTEVFTRRDPNARDSWDVYPQPANREDAEFVTHARTDVPALLDALERARAAAVRLEQELAETTADVAYLRMTLDAINEEGRNSRGLVCE